MSRAVLVALSVASVGTLGCASSTGAAATGVSAEAPSEEEGRPPVADDRSLCEWRGRKDVEVAESRGPGATFENIRRVFTIAGQGEERRRVLRCREIDTNLDGVKDVARWYDEFGKPRTEQADANYDGKLDTWIQFAAGRAARSEVDTNGDGRPDERWFYVRGKPNRVQRDTNGDGRPDVWEVYADGRLDRIGLDLDGDGFVDRWDRDEIARRAAEAAEQQESSEPAPRVPGGSAPGGKAAAESAEGDVPGEGSRPNEGEGKPPKLGATGSDESGD